MKINIFSIFSGRKQIFVKDSTIRKAKKNGLKNWSKKAKNGF